MLPEGRQEHPVDQIFPGLAAGKYPYSLSSFTDTKARQATVNFVTYFLSGTSFYTKASGGTTVNALPDLCGKTVAVEKGTTQQTDATATDGKCKASGKPGVTVQTYPDQNGANLALSSGRAHRHGDCAQCRGFGPDRSAR